jgi:hypothetical protein
VVTFNGATQVAVVPLATITPASGSGGWTALSGTYTVPAGVTAVRHRLGVAATATTGTVWFDDATATKSGLMPQHFVQDLPDDLSEMGTQIQGTIDALWHQFTGQTGGTIIGKTVADLFNAAEQVLTGQSNLDAGKLFNIPGLPAIPQNKIVNLPTDLGATTGTANDALNKAISWVDEVWNRLTGQGRSGVAITDAGEQVQALADIQTANAVAISALQTKVNTVGISGGDTFERVANNDLGTTFWSHTYSSGSASNGFMAIRNGHQAAWVEAGTSERDGRFRRVLAADAVTNTDDQIVAMVLGTQVSETGDTTFGECPTTKIICRMNTAETQYVFVLLRDNHSTFNRISDAQIGYRNGGGEILVGSAVSCTQSAGQSYQLVAAARVFTLLRNGSPITSWNDAGLLSAKGASNRGWGFGTSADGGQLFGIPNGQIKPSSIASITIADYAP